MFFLVFVLFTSRWSVRKVLDCFSNWHLSARFQKQIKEIFLNFQNFRSPKTETTLWGPYSISLILNGVS